MTSHLHRSLRRAFFLGALTLLLPVWPAAASGLDSLEAFIRQTRSGRAAFTQVVTAPPREGQPIRQKMSSGSFEFQRPGRFRFSYAKPFEQLIVADGQTLWLYDVDLNQVSSRRQAQALGNTPAALIASAPDLKSLQADFELKPQPEADGLQWVLAQPRNREGALQSIRVGLRAGDRGVELAALEIVDSFGQRSLLRFSRFEVNAVVPAESFQFKPPAGADVIAPR